MKVKKTRRQFYDSIYILAIKHGLMLAIPFLILGSFALLFNSFPIPDYQVFLAAFLDGGLKDGLSQHGGIIADDRAKTRHARFVESIAGGDCPGFRF